jgi:hypothetical protein
MLYSKLTSNSFHFEDMVALGDYITTFREAGTLDLVLARKPSW